MQNGNSQAQLAAIPGMEMLGDPHPLIEQLGSPAGLGALADASDAARVHQIKSLPGLRAFLRDYHGRVLRPIELPAIQKAFCHAAKGEAREIIALDQKLADDPILKPFAHASQRIGRIHLQRLRPLRDERLVQRYLAAVEEGQAHGWHTLVFGLTLAIYSLPLRQGLLGYAQLATTGFIDAASRSLEISDDDARALSVELCEYLPAHVESLLGPCVAK